jgi:hypothetical protein
VLHARGSALRLLRFGALLRVGRALPPARVVSTSYRATGVARQLGGHGRASWPPWRAWRALAVAQLAWLAERGRGTYASLRGRAPVGRHHRHRHAGDPVPDSAPGRLVMLGGFAVGLVLDATLAGTVGAYLLEERRERAESEQGHPDPAGRAPRGRPARPRSSSARRAHPRRQSCAREVRRLSRKTAESKMRSPWSKIDRYRRRRPGLTGVEARSFRVAPSYVVPFARPAVVVAAPRRSRGSGCRACPARSCARR